MTVKGKVRINGMMVKISSPERKTLARDVVRWMKENKIQMDIYTYATPYYLTEDGVLIGAIDERTEYFDEVEAEINKRVSREQQYKTEEIIDISELLYTIGIKKQ